MAYETITMILPEFWAGALINGDSSNLSDSEDRILFDFVADTVATYGHCLPTLESDSESEFCHWHDATWYGIQACDCLTYSFLVESKELPEMVFDED